MTMSLAEARSAPVSIAELAGWSGLELVARLAEGSIRRPRMAEMLPFTLLPPEEGKVGLLATPEPRFCNLTNTVHGGWIMTMLDTVMALAALTTLSPGETCPSHETTAKFVRPIFVDSGEILLSRRFVRNRDVTQAQSIERHVRPRRVEPKSVQLGIVSKANLKIENFAFAVQQFVSVILRRLRDSIDFEF